MFPRSRERGHIEVSRNRRGLAAGRLVRFRAHVSAATLKSLLIHPMGYGAAHGFRAHVSAATLKLAPQPVGVSRWRFRAHVSAATLKFVVGLLFGGEGACFRAHVSAATLKYAVFLHERRKHVEFPRSRERGHIEVTRPARCLHA